MKIPCQYCHDTGHIDTPLIETCPECKDEMHARVYCQTCAGRGNVPTAAGQEILQLVKMFFGKE